MIVCPHCNRENHESEKICVYCGELLRPEDEGVTTRSLDGADREEGEPRWGSARFGEGMHLVLKVADSGKTFVFDDYEIDELVMGRVDPETGTALSNYEALEKGVSRRHAAIVHRDGSLHVMDMHAPNGTFLNGQKLVPMQPRLLRDSDEIRLGNLVLQVTFYQD